MFRLKMQLFSASFSAVQGPQVWEGWGQNTTTTRGATVIAGAAHVKGAWVELIAATTLEARWVCAAIQGLESARHYAFDMAIGAAGAEQVILPDMQFTGEQTGQFMGPLPLAIQKGARLAARMACQTAGSQSLFSAWGGS